MRKCISRMGRPAFAHMRSPVCRYAFPVWAAPHLRIFIPACRFAFPVWAAHSAGAFPVWRGLIGDMHIPVLVWTCAPRMACPIRRMHIPARAAYGNAYPHARRYPVTLAVLCLLVAPRERGGGRGGSGYALRVVAGAALAALLVQVQVRGGYATRW